MPIINPGGGSGGGGVIDHIEPLEADTHDEADGPEAYQTGFSLEETTSGWADTGNEGIVLTYLDLSSSQGHQVFTDGVTAVTYIRLYNSETAGDWGDWLRPSSGIEVLALEEFGPADGATAYPIGLSLMEVGGGGDWPGTSNEGLVRTYRAGTFYAEQIFSDVWTGKRHSRMWNSGAWTDFVQQADASDVEALDARITALENP